MQSSFIAAWLLVASAAAPRTFDIAPDSTLSYRLVHKFHSVTGVSHSLDGKARILADGTVQVMVRAPLRSFDSGDANRDEHMLEATDAAANPWVLFKAVGAVVPPTSFPAELRATLRGELTLKATCPVEVPVTVRFQSPDHAAVEAEFPVSLEEHRIERPSLMFVKVDDRIVIDAKLTLDAER